MASVLQRGKKKTWYAVFRDIQGRQQWKRVDAPNRKNAQKAADLLEATAQKRKGAQHLRKAFTELYREFYGQSMPTITVRDYVRTWLSTKKHEAAESTFSAYEQVSARFLEFLKLRADEDVADISKAELVGFRNELSDKIGPGRVNFYVKVLRMFFKAAHRDGYLLENPAAYLEIVRNRSNAPGRRPLTIDEIRAVVAIADPEWQSLIRFGLYTGQRLSDLAALTWSNIDLERDEIRLVTRKTGRRLTIPIAEPLRKYLESLPGTDELSTPLHPKVLSALQKGGVASLSNGFVDLLAQAGLREPQSHEGRGIGRNSRRQTSQLSFHSLRHTAVSLLKDAGIPQATVQELIGHGSEQVSALYTHVGRAALEKAAAALPEV